MTMDFVGSTDVKPKALTRSQHPDLRLFTQVPGKLAWLSNHSYKTFDNCVTFLGGIKNKSANRRGIEYVVTRCTDGRYRVLAKPVKKLEVVK